MLVDGSPDTGKLGWKAAGAPSATRRMLASRAQTAREGHAMRRAGALSYNLATARYRQGKVPEAIALLREARVRAPRDGRVHHNLAYLRSELDAVPPPVDDVRPWLSVMTPGELGVLAGLFGLIVFGLIAHDAVSSVSSSSSTWIGFFLFIVAAKVVRLTLRLEAPRS